MPHDQLIELQATAAEWADRNRGLIQLASTVASLATLALLAQRLAE